MTHPKKKYEGKIQDNYDNYLKSPHNMFFDDKFPIAEVLQVFKIQEKCRSFDVTVKVSLCKDAFGSRILVTNRISTQQNLSLNGFGAGCSAEADTMERAIVAVCKKLDLMICAKINSYPAAKCIVQDNHFID
jgi:hypothetical protein